MTKNISITPAKQTRIHEINWDTLQFGKEYSDHMLVMEYADGEWKDPEITALTNFSLHPATSALHYGQAIFEGMKAYKTDEGKVNIFRPEMNARRFAESSERMCMPIIPEDLFIECVKTFVELEREWVSNRPGYSLYIRPFVFATDALVGIRPSTTYKFVIFACPVGTYYNEPVRVKIEEKYTRAAEGGVGRAKAAGNYGSSMYPAKQAQNAGYHQLLWTDAKTHEYVEESGTMNVMFVINGKLVTPSEDQDTILRGVTKRSVIEMAQHWGYEIEERKVSVKEVVDGIKNGNVTEAFGLGTAATIAPIGTIAFRGEDLHLENVNSDFCSKVSKAISDIKTGKAEDILNWNLTV